MKGVYIIMSNIADKFEELGVIPVVVLNDAKDALPLAKALVDGGLPCAEVTFRSISRYGTCSRYSTYNRAG